MDKKVASLLDSESVDNGTFTKFISLVVIAFITLGSLGFFIYASIKGMAIPAFVGIALGAGLSFFAKAAGIADGASISQYTINKTVPAITDALSQMTVSSARAQQANTVATLANTVATKEATEQGKG